MIKTTVKFIKRLFDKRFIKYLITGGLAFIVDYGLLVVLTKLLNVGTGVSASIGMMAGIIVSFGMNKTWTFSSFSRDGLPREFILYLALVAFNYIFTIVTLVAFDELISVLILKPVTVIMITMWNYVIYKKVIFKFNDNQ